MTHASNNAETDHILVIELDEALVKAAHEDGENVDPLDRSLWRISIRCNADPDDFTRSCTTWWECLCDLTDEQHDELSDKGEGPCPKSPTGTHRPYVGDLTVAHPSRDCWAVACDESPDAAWNLADKHKLGPGEYPVHFTSDSQYIEFELADNGS